MEAQRFDPTKKMPLSPLIIPQVAEVGSMGANHEERQYPFLLVPPPTPRGMHRKKSCDAERFRHKKQKTTLASAATSPTLASPTFGGARLVTTTETTLPDSVAFKLPSPLPKDDYYYLTSSDRPPGSGYETSSSSNVGSPIDDYVDRQIIRPQRSRVGLRKSFGNLRKARSVANLPRMPGTATFGVPTPVSSDDSLPSTTSTSTGSSAGSGLKSPRSRRPSLAALSSPVALNEVTDTLRRLKSRLNLRDASTERKWKFDEAVEYYERTWARAESGDGAIEVCVEQTRETVADPLPQCSGPKERQYPDGIGLYARPLSRKNTAPVGSVAEGPCEVRL
ncbi:hypothetical protein GSI_04848 [Ganoderma sinense ZZ0214-1]|uniref:Uncharacterized protein n=1 Tax=Ganoderma sinense ZZ0214-1 TaxID=1077348 RepID=A0A2G8SG52_9APHY|nr:hypothetical protein GSI_04848 [Ganoderma sinense ZZ0214-1]